MERTAMKNSNWQMDPMTLRKICNQRCSVLRNVLPEVAADGTNTRKLTAYCKKSVSNGGAPDTALLSELITAAQKKPAVISAIPAYKLCPELFAFRSKAMGSHNCSTR